MLVDVAQGRRVAASVSAVIGGAVAAVGRHTAAALGVVFVWTAVIEGLIRGFRPLLDSVAARRQPRLAS